jgi:hypothetical protein
MSTDGIPEHLWYLYNIYTDKFDHVRAFISLSAFKITIVRGKTACRIRSL